MPDGGSRWLGTDVRHIRHRATGLILERTVRGAEKLAATDAFEPASPSLLCIREELEALSPALVQALARAAGLEVKPRAHPFAAVVDLVRLLERTVVA